MRVLVTGQVGLDKGKYLTDVRALGSKNGKTIHVLATGPMMIDAYQGKIDEKTILNLPKVLLDLLRRYVWRDILHKVKDQSPDEILIVNSHALFRWHHGMLPSIDLDLLQELSPDIVVTLVDNLDEVKKRLISRGTDFFELWELVAWREEEIWMTRFLAESLQRLTSTSVPKFYVIPMKQGPSLLYRILMTHGVPKVYISFPITHLAEERKKEVEQFKQKIVDEFIGFDPFSISEREIVNLAYYLSDEILEAFEPMAKFIAKLSRTVRKEKLRWLPIWSEREALGSTYIDIGDGTMLHGAEIRSVMEAIDSQIISRDFLLIDQVDFVLMYIRTEDGKPQISAGCQSEMIYAYTQGKPVYVVCECGSRGLSPWVTQFSEVFETLDQAFSYLKKRYPTKC